MLHDAHMWDLMIRVNSTLLLCIKLPFPVKCPWFHKLLCFKFGKS